MTATMDEAVAEPFEAAGADVPQGGIEISAADVHPSPFSSVSFRFAGDVSGAEADRWKGAITTAAAGRTDAAKAALEAVVAELPEVAEVRRLSHLTDQWTARRDKARAERDRLAAEAERAVLAGDFAGKAAANLDRQQDKLRQEEESVATVTEALAAARTALTPARRRVVAAHRAAFYADLERDRQAVLARLAEAATPLLQQLAALQLAGRDATHFAFADLTTTVEDPIR